MMGTENSDIAWRSVWLRNPQDLVGGLVLIGVAALGWWAASDLPAGTANAFGPGMLPRIVLVPIAVIGLALIATSFFQSGPSVRFADFSALLGIAALALAAAVLALALPRGHEILGLPAPAAVFSCLYLVTLLMLAVRNVRSPGWLDRSGLRGPFFVIGGLMAFALTIRSVGLLAAAPMLAMVAGAASSETRFGELVAFALVMTLLCVGVFKYALSLPIPILIVPPLPGLLPNGLYL